MNCPSCGGVLFPVSYDYGVCRGTGRHDSGVTLHCEECGSRFDPDDMPVTEEAA